MSGCCIESIKIMWKRYIFFCCQSHFSSQRTIYRYCSSNF